VNLIATRPHRAYKQPLDQQAGGPLLHPPSPMYPGRNPGAALAEGLLMSPRHEVTPPGAEPEDAPEPGAFAHRPAMLAEVVDIFSAPSLPEGVVVDATVGAGGHARALLEAVPGRRIVGIDQDPDAIVAAREALAPFGDRAVVVKSRFDDLAAVLDELGIASVAGALFDLGVSSPQLDRPERGFSYRADAPLDMRMDPTQGMTAAELVNTSSVDQLARLFVSHGEDRFARRIASAIVAARPMATTGALADVVSQSVPAAVRRRGHPAKRVFQALRAAVNAELEVLPVAVDAAIDRLAPGGRIVVISYHSGEDRIVKERLAYAATGGCSCPPGLPCVCGAQPRLRLLNRGARKPSPVEQETNRRARSARLRAAEALDPAKLLEDLKERWRW